MVRLNLWRSERPGFPLVTWDHFGREFERMYNDMDRMLNPMRSKLDEQDASELNLQVPYQIDEEEGHFLISVEIPGIAREDVQIEVLGRQLAIRGERKGKVFEGKSFARRAGKFQLSFNLPDGVNADGIEAHHEHGILHLLLPKAESMRPRQITIGEGSASPLKKLLGLGKDKEKKDEGKKVS